MGRATENALVAGWCVSDLNLDMNLVVDNHYNRLNEGGNYQLSELLNLVLVRRRFERLFESRRRRRRESIGKA